SGGRLRRVYRLVGRDPRTRPAAPGTKMAIGRHILARGDTHLPFALPRFGTPCAALQPVEQRRRASEYAARIIAQTGNGLLGCGIADPTALDHDHDQPTNKPAGGY